MHKYASNKAKVHFDIQRTNTGVSFLEGLHVFSCAGYLTERNYECNVT